MPRPPGTPKTGGRTKGTPNKRNAELVARVASEGALPLDVMLDIMRRKVAKGDDEGALDAAAKAAPYVHSKLSTVEAKHSGEISTGGADIPKRPETYEEWIARRERDLAAMGAAAGSAAGGH